jgi:SAM-dependent methyltransferase
MKINIFNLIQIEIKRSKRTYQKIKLFKKQFEEFKNLIKDFQEFSIKDNLPYLDDIDQQSGELSEVYFQQDLYIAQKIFLSKPILHVDIGSRIDGFIAHVAVFRKIEVFDIRPFESQIENIKFKKLDLMSDELDLVDYCDSISSLHVLEHFGLGRYGDTIDPNGHIKGFRNITKILKPGGTFYFSVPIGINQRIEFNAHRIFSLKYLMTLIEPDYDINTFSYIDDRGGLNKNVNLDEDLISCSCNCIHGCGIFILKKKSPDDKDY